MFCIEISELNTNSVDPDQTPRSVVSGPSRQCLSIFLLLDASRLNWIKLES